MSFFPNPSNTGSSTAFGTPQNTNTFSSFQTPQNKPGPFSLSGFGSSTTNNTGGFGTPQNAATGTTGTGTGGFGGFGGFGANTQPNQGTQQTMGGGFLGQSTPQTGGFPGQSSSQQQQTGGFGGFGQSGTQGTTTGGFGGFGQNPNQGTTTGGFGLGQSTGGGFLGGNTGATGGFGGGGGGLFVGQQQQQQQQPAQSAFGGSFLGQYQPQQPQQQSTFGGFGTGSTFGGGGFGQRLGTSIQPQQFQQPQSQITPITRWSDLPAQDQKFLEDLEKYITEQKSICEDLNTRTPQMEEYVQSIPADVAEVQKRFDTISHILNVDLTVLTTDLKFDTLTTQTQQTIRLLEVLTHPSASSLSYLASTHGAGGDSLIDFFLQKTLEWQAKVETFKREIAEIDRMLKAVEENQLGMGGTAGDEVLETIRAQWDGFCGLAARVGKIRERAAEVKIGVERGLRGGRI